MDRPRLDPELAKIVQDYANKNFNGNFTKAVDALLRYALISDVYKVFQKERHDNHR